MTTRPAIVAFDMLETVFSLEPLRGRLDTVGLPGAVLELWFARTLRDGFALAATGTYRPFRKVAAGTLAALVAERGRAADAEAIAYVLDGFGELIAHPDAASACRTLRDAGVGLLALSNGAAATTEELLRRAGIRDLFGPIVSIDAAQCWKPRRDIYLYAARAAGVAPDRLALVAAHPWDVHGAKRAGLMAGFVARGQPFPEAMDRPNITGQSLAEVAAAIVRLG